VSFLIFFQAGYSVFSLIKILHLMNDCEKQVGIIDTFRIHNSSLLIGKISLIFMHAKYVSFAPFLSTLDQM